jgi:hypothetical protein
MKINLPEDVKIIPVLPLGAETSVSGKIRRVEIKFLSVGWPAGGASTF